MAHAAYALLLVAFIVMTLTAIRLGTDTPEVIIDCSQWPSVEECFRDGVAPNWRTLKGITIVGPEEED